MMTMLTVLGVWGIVSVVFVLALAAAAAGKSALMGSTLGNQRMETAEEILERLNLVKAPRNGLPVPARTARAH